MTIIAGIEQHSTNEKPQRKQSTCVERMDMCFARINNQNNFYRYFLAHCRTANQKIEIIKVGYMYKTFSNKEKKIVLLVLYNVSVFCGTLVVLVVVFALDCESIFSFPWSIGLVDYIFPTFQLHGISKERHNFSTAWHLKRETLGPTTFKPVDWVASRRTPTSVNTVLPSFGLFRDGWR